MTRIQFKNYIFRFFVFGGLIHIELNISYFILKLYIQNKTNHLFFEKDKSSLNFVTNMNNIKYY